MTFAEASRPLLFEGSSEKGILIIHGFTGTPQSVGVWAEWLHRATGATVSAPLLPGHGTVWQDLNRVSWQDWEAEVLRAFDALAARCRRVAVGGLSLGGLLATLVVSRRPQAVALVLVNHLMWLGDIRGPFAFLLKRLIPAVKSIGGSINKPGVVEHSYDMTPLGGGHQLWKLMLHVRPLLPSIQTPTLILKSRVDHVVPVFSATKTLKKLGSPRKELVWLDRSDHVATLDYDADLVIELSARFFTEFLG